MTKEEKVITQEGESPRLDLPQNETYEIIVPKDIIGDHKMTIKEGEEIIDSTVEYAEPEYVISYRGVGIMPKGNLTIISGKAKQGKSWLITLFTAALLGDKSMGLYCSEKDLKVLIN